MSIVVAVRDFYFPYWRTIREKLAQTLQHLYKHKKMGKTWWIWQRRYNKESKQFMLLLNSAFFLLSTA